jgi:exoribonuclease II
VGRDHEEPVQEGSLTERSNLIPMQPRDLSNSQREIVKAKRQRLIARLMVERPGLYQNEIETIVGKEIKNPETGQPFSHGTINKDMQEIRQRWRDATLEDATESMSRILADLMRLREIAWRKQNTKLLLQVIDREVKLRGLERPKSHINLDIPWESLSREQIERIAAGDPVEDVVLGGEM